MPAVVRVAPVMQSLFPTGGIESEAWSFGAIASLGEKY
jgi:hypothetical protein